MSREEYLYETVVKEGLTLKIYYDTDPQSPRENDNLGTLVLPRSRGLMTELEFESENGDREEDEKRLYAEYGAVLVLPLYRYEHSGVAYRTTPFSCPWDSGQVGFIMVTAARVTELCGEGWGKSFNDGKPIDEGLTENGRKWLSEALEAEVEELSDWANGNVYGYEILDGEDRVDSCWGYIGDSGLKCIREEFDSWVENRIEEEFPLFLACGIPIPEAV